MSCLEQALTVMVLHCLLSYEALMNELLLISFAVAHVFRLSTYVPRCRPLLLLPSIFPVIPRCSRPSFLYTWPMNFICLVRTVFIRDLCVFAISSTSWFDRFSVHDILIIHLENQICTASYFFWMLLLIVQLSHPACSVFLFRAWSTDPSAITSADTSCVSNARSLEPFVKGMNVRHLLWKAPRIGTIPLKMTEFSALTCTRLLYVCMPPTMKANGIRFSCVELASFFSWHHNTYRTDLLGGSG